MKVQLIGANKQPNQFNTITVSPFSAPKSLDEFDIDVIDLSTETLWENDDHAFNSINKISDFVSIKTMLEKKSKSKIVIALPQNVIFWYYKCLDRSSKNYYRHMPLKDAIDTVCNSIFPKIVPTNSFPLKLIFENTRTTIADKSYEADFYFDSNDKQLTKSDLSEKPTTVRLTNNEVYATTLKITSSQEELKLFLDYLFSDRKTETAPDWFSSITFGDDDNQKKNISRKEAEIKKAQSAIASAEGKLHENARYKSILYTNGSELVEVVFDILAQLLGHDFSEFEDKKREDFLIETDEYTLIGEIKGVTSNVRRDNVSQVDNHYNRYLDDHSGADTSKIHQLLIINPLRKQAPDEREPIHEDQIHLARRNGCLIVETNTLLRLFEQFQTGAISTEQCINAFCNTTGLLSLDKITNKCVENLDVNKT